MIQVGDGTTVEVDGTADCRDGIKVVVTVDAAVLVDDNDKIEVGLTIKSKGSVTFDSILNLFAARSQFFVYVALFILCLDQ